MSILDEYKKSVEQEKENMEFPTDTELSEKDKDAYEAVLKKLRKGTYSQEEVDKAIENSKKNMKDFGDTHNGDRNEQTIRMNMERLTDDELISKDLLKECQITDIKVIRAHCPKCGKELVSKAPPMYNPFTMEKVCLHECCGTKYNLDKTYPHIAFYGEEGNEIVTFN